MQPELERHEIESAFARDHDLAVEHTSLRQLRLERFDQLREIAVERLLVAALDEHLVAVAEDERAKAVPLGLEDPSLARGKLAHAVASMGSTGGCTTNSMPHATADQSRQQPFVPQPCQNTAGRFT